MPNQKEESPKQLTVQKNTSKEAAANASRLSSKEQAFWQNIFDRAASPEPIFDPAFYPIYILSRTEDFILNGKRGPDGRLRHEDDRAQLALMQGTIHKVKTAYEILAYSHCQQWRSDQEFIKSNLQDDRHRFGRDRVQLDDTEAKLVGALAQVREIPFDPKKRTYSYSEVLLAS